MVVVAAVALRPPLPPAPALRFLLLLFVVAAVGTMRPGAAVRTEEAAPALLEEEAERSARGSDTVVLGAGRGG